MRYNIFTMMISYLFNNPILFLFLFVALVISITIHEFAHAWAADRLGDPTPRSQGRVTLDPRAHLDPIGTVLIVIAGFGWGKPVEFDPYNLKNPKKDAALIALAGPASNLILAGLIALAMQIPALISVDSIIIPFLVTTVYFNVMLAVFNLVPVHPLDGSKIMAALLPHQMALEYEHFMHRYGTFVLIALILPWNGVSAISQLTVPVISFITSFLLQ